MTLPYPWSLIKPTDKVVCLFVAAFGGRNDLAFVRESGAKMVAAIDLDAAKLQAMRANYPEEWVFAACNGFGALVSAMDNEAAHCDVLTSDPWSGDMEQTCVEVIDAMLKVARRVVIFGCSEHHKDAAVREFAVKGHAVTVTPRDGSPKLQTYWLTVEIGA